MSRSSEELELGSRIFYSARGNPIRVVTVFTPSGREPVPHLFACQISPKLSNKLTSIPSVDFAESKIKNEEYISNLEA